MNKIVWTEKPGGTWNTNLFSVPKTPLAAMATTKNAAFNNIVSLGVTIYAVLIMIIAQ